MKVKTSELIGPALDWAVAKCEGHQWRCPWLLEKEGYAAWNSYEHAWGSPTPEYSTDWSQGGPIIERELICADAGDGNYQGDKKWAAWYANNVPVFADATITGPTLLIAAMRCYVASKLGDEIEMPEGLL